MDASFEKFRQLMRGEEQRKAAHKETVRAALAAGLVPVPDEVLNGLLRLFVTDAIDVLRSHPGFVLEDKIRSLRTTFTLFSTAHENLITALDQFDQFSREPLFNYRAGESQAQAIENQIRKEIFAFSALAHSLQDYCRSIRNSWEPPDTPEQLGRCFGDDGLHNFICGLRNALHHRSMVEASWEIRDLGPNATSHYLFRKGELLAIDRPWNVAARAFLSNAAEEIDVRTLAQSYFPRVRAFYEWFIGACEASPPPDVEDYRRCWTRHRRRDVLNSWSFLLNEILKRNIDPYPYLQNRYLTEGEYAQAMSLPMRSQEQVDFIINTVDQWGACDSDMRARAYQLFGVRIDTPVQDDGG